VSLNLRNDSEIVMGEHSSEGLKCFVRGKMGLHVTALLIL